MRQCSNCRLGNLYHEHVTYANWHSGRFVIVPNMPAWMCDVCGDYEYDADALSRLMPLLGPITRPASAQSQRSQMHANGDLVRDGFDPDRDRRRA